MKYLRYIVLILALFLVACDVEINADTQAEIDANVPQEVQEEIKNAPQEDHVFEDKEDAIVTEKVQVDIKNDVVEVEIDEEVIVDKENLGAPFSEWCIKGETFVYKGDDGEIESELQGVVTYKEGEFCEGKQTQVMQTPIGEMTIESTYYISEDQKEFYVVTDTMGQKTESHIKLD